MTTSKSDQKALDAKAPGPKPEEKKEFTPKVRNAGYFLFEQDGTSGGFMQVASYSDLKSFQEGVKEKARAISDDKEIPNWVRFHGEFKKIKIERIRDVKVRL